MTPSHGGLASSIPNGARNSLRRLMRRLVFPHAHDEPSDGFESGVCLDVARAISVELGRPVARVCTWANPVIRAAVPETSVEEYGNTLAREDDVGLAADRTHSTRVLPKSETEAMQLRPQRDLGARVRATVALHYPTNGGCGCGRRGRDPHARTVAPIAHSAVGAPCAQNESSHATGPH